jgi:hypothetical protein
MPAAEGLAKACDNAESFTHRKFGKNWRGLEPSRHLHVFSRNNLQTVLHRHNFCHVSVQTNAANARGLFEESYPRRQGIVSRDEKYPSTYIYCMSLLLQYKEWILSRAYPQIGEGLFVQAFKQSVVREGSQVELTDPLPYSQPRTCHHK